MSSREPARLYHGKVSATRTHGDIAVLPFARRAKNRFDDSACEVLAIECGQEQEAEGLGVHLPYCLVIDAEGKMYWVNARSLSFLHPLPGWLPEDEGRDE